MCALVKSRHALAGTAPGLGTAACSALEGLEVEGRRAFQCRCSRCGIRPRNSTAVGKGVPFLVAASSPAQRRSHSRANHSVCVFAWAAPDCRCKPLLGEREREIDGKRDRERERSRKMEREIERKRDRERERESRERQRGGKHLELAHTLQQLLCNPA
jgi:hypothetical protein